MCQRRLRGSSSNLQGTHSCQTGGQKPIRSNQYKTCNVAAGPSTAEVILHCPVFQDHLQGRPVCIRGGLIIFLLCTQKKELRCRLQNRLHYVLTLAVPTLWALTELEKGSLHFHLSYNEDQWWNIHCSVGCIGSHAGLFCGSNTAVAVET